MEATCCARSSQSRDLLLNSESSTLAKKNLLSTVAGEPGLIPELDGLRAFAVVLVVGRHATRVFSQPIAPIGKWDAATMFINGWMGVDLFFVLSGFLIALHLVRSDSRAPAGRAFNLASYLKKRALRIVPAYYTWLLLVALVGVPGYFVASDHLGMRLAYHLAFLQDYLPSDIVVAFWSLGVEEKFYLLAPFVVLGLLRKPQLRYGALLVGIAVPSLLRWWRFSHLPKPLTYLTHFTELRSPFHMSVDGLLVGVLCAFVWTDREKISWTKWKHRSGLLLGMAAMLAGGPMVITPMLEGEISGLVAVTLALIQAIGFGCAVLAVALGPSVLSRFLGSVPLRFVSKISYSLYLVHMAFVHSTYVAVQSELNRLPGTALKFCAYFLAYSLVSVLAALGLHLLVERPFLQLKGRIRS